MRQTGIPNHVVSGLFNLFLSILSADSVSKKRLEYQKRYPKSCLFFSRNFLKRSQSNTVETLLTHTLARAQLYFSTAFPKPPFSQVMSPIHVQTLFFYSRVKLSANKRTNGRNFIIILSRV